MTTGEAAVVGCCQNFDEKTAQKCAVCNVAICGNCFEIFEASTICKSCFVKVIEELANEVSTSKDLPMAILGGLLGAIVGALLWMLVVVLTNTQVGFVAIGVGWLAGQGVALFVKRRKSFQLQIVSAIFAMLGCVFGYVSITAHWIVKFAKTENGLEINYFDINLWLNSIELQMKNFDFFALLMIAIAVYFSWRISAPIQRYHSG